VESWVENSVRLLFGVFDLPMGYPQAGDGARLGQGFPAVSRRRRSGGMRSMMTKMLQVGAGIRALSHAAGSAIAI
jgi:hypothetical protein